MLHDFGWVCLNYIVVFSYLLHFRIKICLSKTNKKNVFSHFSKENKKILLFHFKFSKKNYFDILEIKDVWFSFKIKEKREKEKKSMF